MSLHTLDDALTRIPLSSRDEAYEFRHQTAQWVVLYCYVDCSQVPYHHYIKQLCEDGIAHCVSQVESADSIDIPRIFEEVLLSFNAELATFYEKFVDYDTDPQSLRGVLWCVVEWRFLCSILGEGSIFVIRNKKIHYTVANHLAPNQRSIFADMLDGELDIDDIIISFGIDYAKMYTKADIKALWLSLQEYHGDLADYFHQSIKASIDPDLVWWIIALDYGKTFGHTRFHLRKNSLQASVFSAFGTIQKNIFLYRYAVAAVIVLGIVWRLAFSIFRDMQQLQANTPTIDVAWETRVVTIETIRQDIEYFQRLDPTSPTKSQYYNQIIQHLAFLESLGRWPNDVKELKALVQNKYYEWFNVVYINDLMNNVDTPQLLTFTASERQTLWEPVRLFFSSKLNIAWSQWAIMGAINNDLRGSFLSYSLWSDVVAGCSPDVMRLGMYCFTSSNALIRITEGGVENVVVVEWEDKHGQFDTPITDIAVFARNNMYLLHRDPALNEGMSYVTRYRNQVGSSTQFSSPLRYINVGDFGTGMRFDFASMYVDGSFLMWNRTDRQMYQLWRETSPTNLNTRRVSIQWWDFLDRASENVRILTQEGSAFVYFFDRDRQTFTVFKSTPLRTQERFTFAYNLQYVFQFAFDLGKGAIKDVAIPEAKSQGESLFILTDAGVHQIALGEFLGQFDK